MRNSRRVFSLHSPDKSDFPKTSGSTVFPTIQSLRLDDSVKPTCFSAHRALGNDLTSRVSSHPMPAKLMSESDGKDITASSKLPEIPRVRNSKEYSIKYTTIAILEASQRDAIVSEEGRLWKELLQSLPGAADVDPKGADLESPWCLDYANMQRMLDSHQYSRAYLALSALMPVNKTVVGRFVILSAMRAFCSYQMYNYTECADDSQTCWRVLTCARPGEEVVLGKEDKPLVSLWLNVKFLTLWTRSLLLCEAYDEAEDIYSLVLSQEARDRIGPVISIFNLTEDDLSLLRRERDSIPEICSFRQNINNKEWSSALAVIKSKRFREFIEATSLKFLEAVALFESGKLDASREALLVYLVHIPFHSSPSSDDTEYWCEEERQLQRNIEKAYLHANLFLSKVSLYCGRVYINVAAVLVQRCLAVDPRYMPAINFGCHLVELEDFISTAESKIEAGQFQNAVSFLTSALAMDSKNKRINAFLFVMRAEVYLKLSRPLQAIEDCTRSIELDRLHVKAYFVRSIAYQRTQQTAQAAADRDIAVEFNSSYRDFYEDNGSTSGGPQKTFTNKCIDSRHQNPSKKRLDLPKSTLYDVLGVCPCATLSDIRQAFKRLTLQCHPDKVVNESKDIQQIAMDRFKVLNQAHSVLTDPEERSAYDLSLGTM